MRKIVVLIGIVILTPLVAGLYGVLHDQFTYSISPEYFTRFKFYQFGLVEEYGNGASMPNPRLAVAMVGFMATWWTGIVIGLGLGLTALFQTDANAMLRTTAKAVAVVVAVAMFTGLIGLAYGKFYLATKGVNWWLPDNLIDREAFITVGSMHNFSYLGGGIGLLAGMAYQLIIAHKTNPDFGHLLSGIVYFGLKKPK